MVHIKTLEEIVATLKKYEPELRSKYGIKRIGVFGSVVRREVNRRSDLDLLVEFDQDIDIGLLRFLEIENYLSRLLEMKVDLVERSALKPFIGKRIMKEVIYP